MTREERTQRHIEDYEHKKSQWQKTNDYAAKRETFYERCQRRHHEAQWHMAQASLQGIRNISKYRRLCCVYGLVNLHKELFYVGCTKDLAGRLTEHRRNGRAAYSRSVVILEILNPTQTPYGDKPWIQFFSEQGIVLQQCHWVPKSKTKLFNSKEEMLEFIRRKLS